VHGIAHLDRHGLDIANADRLQVAKKALVPIQAGD